MKPQQKNSLSKYTDKEISAFFLIFLAFGVLICLVAFILFSFSFFIGTVFLGIGLFLIIMSAGYWQEIKRREKEETTIFPVGNAVKELPAKNGTIVVYKEPFMLISEIRSLKKYAIVDVETTGLSKVHDRIIEIGIVIIDQGSIADTYETTVNPEMHISPDASLVNGIYDKDVMDSPKMEDVIEEIWKRLSDRTLIAYNASFDVEFISKALSECGISGEIRYIDALTVAKRAYPSLSNYKLSTVSKALKYGEDQQHRALSDVYMTYYVFENSLQKILSDHEESLKNAKKKEEEAAKVRFQKFSKSPIVNKSIAFTGEFQTDREQLESMVEKVGAVFRSNVVKKLDYLVVGNTENLPDWALERKIRKAERYISEGCPIQTISEGEYLSMVGMALSALKNENAPI